MSKSPDHKKAMQYVIHNLWNTTVKVVGPFGMGLDVAGDVFEGGLINCAAKS